MSRQQQKIVKKMWYKDAIYDDGFATAAYSDEDKTTDVESYEVANDVFVVWAIEQARKCFALERRREGKRHTKPFHSVQFSLFTIYLACQKDNQLFLGCIFINGAWYPALEPNLST
jgi:hypothetical protein